MGLENCKRFVHSNWAGVRQSRKPDCGDEHHWHHESHLGDLGEFVLDPGF